MEQPTACSAGFTHNVEHLRTVASIKAEGLPFDSATVEFINGAEYALLSREVVKNLMPVEGINYMIGTALTGQAQLPSWFIAPFSGNYTPVSTVTAATFPAAATEATGYAEATRQAWTPGVISAGGVTNGLSVATFTINPAGAGMTLYGCAISSVPTKSSVAGVLISCARFAAPKLVADTDIIRVTSPFAMTSV